jgi:mycothiol system anti-sigma-R factor
MGSPEVGCGRVLAHLWQYVDREMSRAACAELEAHLPDCPICRAALEADRNLKRLVRRCSQVEPVPPERIQALVVRVRRSIAVGDLPPAD